MSRAPSRRGSVGLSMFCWGSVSFCVKAGKVWRVGSVDEE